MVIDEGSAVLGAVPGSDSNSKWLYFNGGTVTPAIKRQDGMWLDLLDSYAHLILQPQL